MAFVAFGLLQFNNNYAIQFIWILCCTVSYFLVLMLFSNERKILTSMKEKLLNSLAHKH